MRLPLRPMLSRVQKMLLPFSRLLFRRVPGPVLLVSVKKEFFGNPWTSAMNEGMRRARHWSKMETELFAAFVSRRNQCVF